MGLWIIEEFPLSMIAAGLFTNMIGFNLLKSFPFIELTSLSFLLTCGKLFNQVLLSNFTNSIEQLIIV